MTKEVKDAEPTVTIDSKKYSLLNASDETKALISQIQFMEQKLRTLQREVSIFQSSRSAAIKQLSVTLNEINEV
ncbi:DUF6447 family protein [Paracoccaceae bacterium]|nr:DUF6447 family protein [Paracoccaceae bacterium]